SDRLTSHANRGLDPLARERQFAQACTGRIRDGIGKGGGRWPLRCLAGAEERLARSVDQMDIDAVGQIGKAQDLIGLQSRLVIRSAAGVGSDFRGWFRTERGKCASVYAVIPLTDDRNSARNSAIGLPQLPDLRFEILSKCMQSFPNHIVFEAARELAITLGEFAQVGNVVHGVPQIARTDSRSCRISSFSSGKGSTSGSTIIEH